jgi:hypothetical protein
MADRATLRTRLDRLADEVGAPDPPLAAAELMVAAAYVGRNRDIWGGDKALTFWDRFPDRVRAACYRGPTPAHWWEAISRMLDVVAPAKVEDRRALVAALGHSDGTAVLSALRTQPEALCLRVRLAFQLSREDSATSQAPAMQEELS